MSSSIYDEVTTDIGRSSQCIIQTYEDRVVLLQYVEVALIQWEADYKLATLLLAITIGANSIVIARMYSNRLKLYQSVSQRRLIPIVQAGRVR